MVNITTARQILDDAIKNLDLAKSMREVGDFGAVEVEASAREALDCLSGFLQESAE